MLVSLMEFSHRFTRCVGNLEMNINYGLVGANKLQDLKLQGIGTSN
jgi:hypothetical protein